MPVKLLWTREDDMEHDYYRPGGFQFLKAGVDAIGQARRVAQSLRHATARASSFVGVGRHGARPNSRQRFVPNFALHDFGDAARRSDGRAARAGQQRVSRSSSSPSSTNWRTRRARIRCSSAWTCWRRRRSRSSSDGAARLRRRTHERRAGTGRARNRAGASARCPRARRMGIGFHFSHRGYFAEVAEVTVDADNKVKVNKVWVAGDIGSQIINPARGGEPGAGRRDRWHERADGAGDHARKGPRAAEQLQPAPDGADGAGAAGDRSALRQERTTRRPGLGEPSLPPILPAVTNAIFAATGKRVRSLPLSKSGFSWA